MKAKIEIPCEISKGLSYFNVYQVYGTRMSDGIVVPLTCFFHEDDAKEHVEFAKKTFASLYSHVYMYQTIVWL